MKNMNKLCDWTSFESFKSKRKVYEKLFAMQLLATVQHFLVYLRRSSLGWFLLSRLRSIRSESRCLRMSVAYSSRPCRAVMMSEAT